MALLDEIPADILLDVLEYLPKDQGDPRFYSLQRLAGTSSKLRQCLLPLLYKDVLFECEIVSVDSNGDHIEEHDTAESEGSQEINRIRHNAYLAQSADGPGYAHRVLMLVNEFADPDEIVRIVRDEMDVGNAAKWPNLRSYAYIYSHRHVSAGHSYSTSQVAKRLEKELPVLKQAPIISGSIAAFSPSLPASFLAQLTSLTLSCDNQGIDANYLPKFFAPTLVRLKFVCVRPENIWNIFYDGQNKRSVVFANLRRLDIAFENPRRWEEDYMDHDELPSSKGNLIDRDLAKMSLWTTKTLGKLADYRIPSFPQLESFRCDNLIYSFRELASHIQCQSSLRNLYVANRHLYFDFDPSRFENLERVEFRCISDNLDNASNTDFGGNYWEWTANSGYRDLPPGLHDSVGSLVASTDACLINWNPVEKRQAHSGDWRSQYLGDFGGRMDGVGPGNC
ncbi:hypothetical protein GGI12_004456 [Dipsacomyces acuminosporus]|nr:hypothetical protein GGI12_004456 [Dipsacomyces acuminosporus]